MYNYSIKELKMFAQIQPEIDTNLVPYEIYNKLILRCFALSLEGKAVESLRRCAFHFLYKGDMYRLSPEFEGLIQLD